MCSSSLSLIRCLLVALSLGFHGIVWGQDQKPASDADLPSSVDLYHYYIQANGGRANIQALNTLVATGTLEAVDGDVLEFKVVRKRPDKLRFKVNFEGYTLETFYNGKQGWKELVRNDGAKKVVELEGDELLSVMADAVMESPLFQLAGLYDAMTPVAIEDVRGHEAIRVEIDPSAGIQYHSIWLSTEHFQEVKLARTDVGSDAAQAPVESEIYCSDFERIDGIYHATTMGYCTDGELTQTIRIDRIRTNVGIFDSYFKKN